MDPAKLSPAVAIKAFQAILAEYRLRPESPDETLGARLRSALLDDYQRSSSKTSRSYPRKKQRESTRAPKIENATRQQIEAAKQFKEEQEELQLTAWRATRKKHG